MKEIEDESVLSQAADQHEHQRLMALIDSEREHAHTKLQGVSAQT